MHIAQLVDVYSTFFIVYVGLDEGVEYLGEIALVFEKSRKFERIYWQKIEVQKSRKNLVGGGTGLGWCSTITNYLAKLSALSRTGPLSLQPAHVWPRGNTVSTAAIVRQKKSVKTNKSWRKLDNQLFFALWPIRFLCPRPAILDLFWEQIMFPLL